VAICHVYSSRKEDAQRAERQQLAQLGSMYDIDECLRYAMSGRLAHQVHALAKRLYADLIVVGTHGRHGLDLARGNVANAVLHGATCDALSVRLAA
jgi:universal stress protein A